MTGDTICIIPARGGSKGIPKKNIRNFLGSPLIAWTIAQARLSNSFQRIIVSTDSPSIKKIAIKYGAEVPFLRPKVISGDHASSEEAIIHAIEWLKEYQDYEPKIVAMMQATSPIRKKTFINSAVDYFKDNNFDSMLSAVISSNFLWQNLNSPRPLYDHMNRPRRQDIHKNNLAYKETGSFYMFKTDEFMDIKNRLFGKIGIFLTDDEEGIDIDTQSDWDKAELMLKYLLKDQNNYYHSQKCNTKYEEN